MKRATASKIEPRKETGSILNGVVQEGLTEEVAFEQRIEGVGE